MSGKQTGGAGHARHDDPSPTVGVGGPTSGEAGATPFDETMAETGGSGGDALTGNEVGTGVAGATPTPARQAADDDVVDSGARGFQDTRSEQAGGSETGLGVPETGANQTPEDLDRRH
jgi:hypothetical protein